MAERRWDIRFVPIPEVGLAYSSVQKHRIAVIRISTCPLPSSTARLATSRALKAAIKSVIVHKMVRIASARGVAPKIVVIVHRHAASPRATYLKSIGPKLLGLIGTITWFGFRHADVPCCFAVCCKMVWDFIRN
jgi:hypothetical protein